MLENEERITSWLTEIFHDQNFDSCTIEFQDFDKNGGYIGEMNFADVIAEKNGVRQIIRLIIKKNKESDEVMKILNGRQVYASEVKLYSKVLKAFNDFAKENNTAPFEYLPHCYGTINREDLYVIIMENLKPKGFKIHELQQHMDLDHVKLVLEAYGRWHAFNLAFRDQKPKIFQTLGTIMENTKMVKMYKNTVKYEIDETIKLFKNKNENIVEKLKKLSENYIEMMDDALRIKNENYLVLKHGDSWNNNFLFHYDEKQKKPDKVVIVDWQMSFLGSPLFDVANFIFGCCSKNELEHINDLLKFYYSTLSINMKELGSEPADVFPWEACLKSFERYAPLGISTVPLLMRMRYKVDNDSHYDIGNCVDEGVFIDCYGEGIREPEKHFRELEDILEYVIKREWI